MHKRKGIRLPFPYVSPKLDPRPMQEPLHPYASVRSLPWQDDATSGTWTLTLST